MLVMNRATRNLVNRILIGLALAAGPGMGAGIAATSIHASFAAPQTISDPRAIAIIEEMAAHYSKLQSVQVDTNGDLPLITIMGKANIRFHVTLALQRPDRYAYYVDSTTRTGDRTTNKVMLAILGNGRSAISYNGSLKQYTRSRPVSLAAIAAQRPARPDMLWGGATKVLLAFFIHSPEDRAAKKFFPGARLVGRKLLNGTPVAVIEYFPLPGKLASLGKYFIAVDTRSDVLVRCSDVIAPQNPFSAVETEDVRPVSVNELLPDSVFNFRPPPGARLVAKFSAPSG